MANGYVNLPQTILDRIPNLPEITPGTHSERINDKELARELRRIGNLGKPVVASFRAPFGVTATLSGTIITFEDDTGLYQCGILFEVPHEFTLVVSASSEYIPSADGVDYDEYVTITFQSIAG